MRQRRISRSSRALLVAATLAVPGVLAGCGGSGDQPGSGGGVSGSGAQLNLVAYSAPKKAYDALTAAFEKTPQGKGVSFASSFGSSGAQSRAVDTGQPADVVNFSTEPDIARLVTDGIVSPSWDANPYKGIVADSVV